MASESNPIRAYAGLLTVLAVLAGTTVPAAFRFVQPWPLMALLLLTLLLSNLAVELPFAASLSLTFAPIFAGLLVAGPIGGAVLGLASAVSLQEVSDRKPPVLMLINLTQLFLAGLAAGWVLVALGGWPLLSWQNPAVSVTGGLVAPALAVMVFFLLNLLFVGVALALKTGMRASATVRALNPGAYWISLLVLALLGYVMAHLIGIASWLGLLLLVLPFAMARRTFRVYEELSEAYTTTVRSLVAAIEAKDPYTRGHSERVAVLSRAVAERTGLQASEIDLMERAALLHDVGKIGIKIGTLTSPSRLTADEVREIRTHPTIGSDLLESVEFLSDVVPIIRHHHEHVDGAGYPAGLVGDEIPLLSRILATADAYDAMTSDRAYRVAMTREQAIDEMRRVSGHQLDEALVSSFIEVLDSDVLGASQ